MHLKLDGNGQTTHGKRTDFQSFQWTEMEAERRMELRNSVGMC